MRKIIIGVLVSTLLISQGVWAADVLDETDNSEVQTSTVREIEESSNEGTTENQEYVVFAKEELLDAGTCGLDVSWELYMNGTLVISGSGNMRDYSYDNPAPWNNYVSTLTEVQIKEGITGIGESAFNECSAITKITLPDSLTSIGNYAFSWCESLKDIVLPKGVTNLGEGVFNHCSSLESIALPQGVTSVSNNMFYECNSLTSVVLPNSVTSIGAWAFCGCISLKEIELPKGITCISSWSFYCCSGLTSVVIPDGTTGIGSTAFTSCKNLKEIYIPKSVIGIGTYALPESIVDVYYEGSEAEWAAINKDGSIDESLVNATFHFNYVSGGGDYLRGDVNEDSKVNIQDMRMVLYSLSGKNTLTSRQQMIADVTDDGQVTIQDLRTTLRYVCGKVESL